MSADLRELVLARLDEQMAVCEVATKGPWRLCHAADSYGGIEALSDPYGWVIPPDDEADVAADDWTFIVSSRYGWPVALRSLRREVERHVESHQDGDHYCLFCQPRHGVWPCKTITETARDLGVGAGKEE